MPATAMSVPAGMTAKPLLQHCLPAAAAFKNLQVAGLPHAVKLGKEHFNHEEIIGKNFPLKSITVTDGLKKELPVSIHDTCRLLLRKEDPCQRCY